MAEATSALSTSQPALALAWLAAAGAMPAPDRLLASRVTLTVVRATAF